MKRPARPLADIRFKLDGTWRACQVQRTMTGIDINKHGLHDLAVGLVSAWRRLVVCSSPDGVSVLPTPTVNETLCGSPPRQSMLVGFCFSSHPLLRFIQEPFRAPGLQECPL